jgi:ribonuclease HI
LEFQNQTNTDTFLIINIYNDPLLVNNSTLTKLLDFHPSPQTPVILAGDFNLHHPMWSEEGIATSSRAEEFVEWIYDNGFVIFNRPHEFTFFHRNAAFSPTIIDLTFANAQSLVREWDVPNDKDVGSDHCTLSWNIDKSLQEDFELETFSIKERKKEKWVDTFKSKMAVTFPTSPLTSTVDIDRAAASLQEAISEATEETMSRTRITHKSVIWWNPEIEKVMRELREIKTQVKDAYKNRLIPPADLLARLRRTENRKKKTIRTSKMYWINQRMAEADSKDIWKMARWFRGIRRYKIPALVHNGRTATTNADKRTLLYEVFFPEVRSQVNATPTSHKAERTHINITKGEVLEALASCKDTSAPGRSAIGYKLVKWAWHSESDAILSIFQACLSVGHHPTIWKNAVAVAVPKPNKSDYSAAKAYRPISLLECISKLLEKIIARRITFEMGRHKLVSPSQFAGRRNTSINDAALTVIHDIQRAWQFGHVATILTFDISGYFNNIHHGYLIKMLKAKGFATNLVLWTESFLKDRTITMSINDDSGAPAPFTTGVPQGSPLSPCFSSLYTADLLDHYDKQVIQNGYTLSLYMYIDDGLLMCISPTLDRNVEVLKNELNFIKLWLKGRGLGFDVEKSELMHFSKRRRDPSPPITITDTFDRTETIVARQSLRWLGIFFDRKLNFKKHVDIMANRGACKVAGLRMLGNTVRGLSHRHLRHLYKAVVIPTITFGAPVWFTGIRQKMLVQKLEKVQNNMLRQICGAFRTSPVAALQAIASIPPLSLQLHHLRRGMATRLLKLQHNSTLLSRLPAAWRSNTAPLHNTPIDGINTRRKKLNKTNLDRISDLVEPQSEKTLPFAAPPWRVRLRSHERFHLHPPDSSRYTTKEDKRDRKKKEKERVLEEINRLRTQPDTIRVFTDGSLSEGRWMRAGSGVSAWVRNRKAFERAVTSRTQATSYDAEMYALTLGLGAAIEYAKRHDLHHIAIFSDCASALQAITDYTPKPAQYLSILFTQKALAFLNNPANRISLHWTPSHCGIEGNERADELAKIATRPNRPIVFPAPSIAFHKAYSKHYMAEEWNKEWKTTREKLHLFRPAATHPPSLRPSLMFRSLSNKKEVFGRMTQMMTGHGYIGEYYKRFHIDDDTQCNTDKCLQTRQHIIAECSKFRQHRRELKKVSHNMSLQVLLGSRKGLRAMATFIEESGAFTKNGRPFRRLELKELLSSHEPPST